MYSKALSLIIILFTLSSCSWWGGEVKNTKVIELDEAQILGNSSECITGLNLFFSNYFRGNTDDAEIERNFRCVSTSVAGVFENAKEKDIDKGFDRQELFEILHAVFPKRDKGFLKKNIEILFLIKRLFVGGKEDRFSRNDHKKVEKVLPLVAEKFKTAKTDIKYIFYAENSSLKDRDKAFKSLELVFNQLDSVKKANGGVFSISEGSKLVDFIFDGSGIEKFKPLASIVKTFVFGADEDSFKVSQKDFFSRLFVALEFQARSRLSSFKEGFLIGETYYDLTRALNLLSDSILKWSDQEEGPKWKLDTQIFEEIIVSLDKLNLLNGMFEDPVFASSSIKKIVATIFGSEILDRAAISKLSRVLKGWVVRQNSLLNTHSFVWAKPKVSALNPESKRILKEVFDFKLPRFVSDGSGDPIVIKRAQEDLISKELYFDQSLKHLITSLAYEFFQAYSSETKVSKQGGSLPLKLKLKGLSRIFADIRPLGLELGFVDPHHCGSENRVFIEADSLTMSGDGSGEVSIREAVEWTSTMISLSSLSNHVFKNIESSCALPGLTVLGSPFLDRKCAHNKLFSRIGVFRDHFPGTLSYVDMLKSDSLREDFENKRGSLLSWFKDFKKFNAKEFSDAQFGSFNSCTEFKSFPFSKREFNTSLAVSIYGENLFHQFDKTGISSLKVVNWVPRFVDPEGADFVLDGKEVSLFLKKKLSKKLPEVIKNLDYFPDYFTEVIALNLTENALAIDRARAYDLLNSLMGLQNTEPHQFSKNFCRDVERSSASSIFYKKEERLMCLGDNFKNSGPKDLGL